MGSVCVEVAVLTDRRLLDALDSLRTQSRLPDRVLIAASTRTPDALLDEARRHAGSLPLEVARFDGGVVDARAGALPLLREELTAFLDSDERAPPEWLARLVAPIESGTADFSGGPTRPARAPETSIERYYDLLERSIYENLVPRSITYIPLQNTAWKTPILRSLGFDPRIPFAEDHDLETRAARAGARGTFVPEAFVYHDKSDETSLLRWARKRYRYLVAMAMSLLKNGALRGRLEERRPPVRHPLRYVEALMKPVALLHASIRWRRLRTRTPV
ncbi:MAG: glycosyltransferase [Thermoplasmata archaeon]